MTAAHLWVLRCRKASVDATYPHKAFGMQGNRPAEAYDAPPARGRRGVRTRGADGFVGSTTVNDGDIGTAATRAQQPAFLCGAAGVSTHS